MTNKKNEGLSIRGVENGRQKMMQAEYYAGPLPSPKHLQEYEDITPGIADRIVSMAENQSEHRQELESIVVRHDSVRALLGIIFAFVIVLLGIGAAVYLVMQDKDIAALIAGIVPLGSVVVAFIHQAKSSKKDD